MSNLATLIPMGSDEFIESVNRLKDSEDRQEEMFKLATECCKLCNRSINCEDCFVQTIGDLKDPYRDKIEKKTITGMYCSGIYIDSKGKYHYAHPQGSG